MYGVAPYSSMGPRVLCGEVVEEQIDKAVSPEEAKQDQGYLHKGSACVKHMENTPSQAWIWAGWVSM